ncbi:MAG: PQQ-like beta-propeller repeat protein, partial [Verrucomicrobiaceae bacterium]|nr:PQQ-like beta-propeller repeat protein [Verrucomicrobiaceae bacterium]
MKSALLPAFLLANILPLQGDDWPQWRGPQRNGVSTAEGKLPEALSEENAPAKIWESTEEIPSDHYGGHGSVAVADGKVFLSLVWHRDEPTETRRIDGEVLAKLDYRGTNSLPPEIVEKMETDRLNLSRRLRGDALDQWAKKWVEDHLDEKTKLSLGGWIISRFKKGRSAIPLPVYETLTTVSKEVFPNQEAMEKWVRAQNFDPAITIRILAAVADTKKVADDVVIALDAATGARLWRFDHAGFPSGRTSSSTPTIADGKVYAALSEYLYCLEAATGKEIWRAPLTGRKGPASSPLVLEGRVFLQQNFLSAFDAATGTELWKNNDVRGSHPSPAAWRDVIICNSQKHVIGVDAANGKTLWKVPGGGASTPVISGDHLVVSSQFDGKNLIAYRLTPEGATELWSHGFLAQRYCSSPILYEGVVYHLGSDRHLCLDLATGEIKWERPAQSSLSSPILSDGKLLVYENRGGFVKLIRATPEDYSVLGRAKVGALRCASPAIVGNTLYLRT